MSDSSNICLSCGLCCDGTVIGFVQVDADELPALREIKIMEEDEGKAIFLQPCELLCDGCTIYEHRPKQCALFKCGLLTSVEQNELLFTDALDTVEEVKQLKSKIEQYTSVAHIELKSRSFYFKTLELKKMIAKDASSSDRLANSDELVDALSTFDMILKSKFDLD